ncbi:MAG: hypothetical protein KF838_02580 [Phycisphaeraceae bacterium]|nr:MAG: hypothetical protein KF838_02580 [Phycisphaeraceae bacterium]
MRRGSTLKIAAIGLVGVAAASVFGYRAVTGDCIFGTCESKVEKQAIVTPVAATSGTEEACPMGCSEGADAKVQNVAHTTESECQGKAAECADKAAECAEKASECADKAADCSEKAAACTEKVASSCADKSAEACATAGADCADDCNAESCEKPDCCKKVAQKDTGEKIGG